MRDICPDSDIYPCDPTCDRCGRLVGHDPLLTAVAEAARALHATGCFGYPSDEYLALGAALKALDGGIDV